MSVLHVCKRRLARGFTVGTVIAVGGAWGGTAAAGTASAAATAHAAAPRVSTDHGCYRVGTPVHLSGSGFTPARSYVVSIDGVFFGESQTDAAGAFGSSLQPGGLSAGVAEVVDRLDVSDGTLSAHSTITVTRAAGARFLATSGNANTLRAPLEAWGFAVNGGRPWLYMHYVSPGGNLRRSVRLGRVGGQCGYLRTKPRLIFPFSPSRGGWTLQVDTHRRYAHRPQGPVTRIRLQIS